MRRYFDGTAFFATGAAGALARNHAAWSANRQREDLVVIGTLRLPSPYRSASRVVASAGDCAACRGPCDGDPLAAFEEGVTFCVECRERASPPGFYDEIGGSG